MDVWAQSSESMDGDFKAMLKMRQEKKVETNPLYDQTLKASIAELAQQRKMKFKETIETVIKATKPDFSQLRMEAFDAVRCGNDLKLSGVLASFRSQGLDPKELSDPESGENLLHCALSQAKVHSEILQRLLCMGDNYICATYKVDLEEGKKTNKSCLHIATEKGNLDLAHKLITTVQSSSKKTELLHSAIDVIPEGQRPRPLTCLHIAAKLGHNDMVRYFVQDCMMDVNLTNNKNDTPILWAANDNHPETVRLLIQLGAEVNGQNDKGSSALHWACRSGSTDVVKVLLFESKNINVNIKRQLGLVCPIIVASAMGHLDIVQMLIDKGADVSQRIRSGQTALHFAAAEAHDKVIVLLLKAGAELDAADDQGNTPLMHAASHAHHQTVVRLAECGSNVDHKNTAGKTAWDFALEHISSALLKAMVDFMSRNKLPNPASGRGQTATFKDGVTPLHLAAALGDCEKVQYLLNELVSPATVDGDHCTFLHYATRNNRLDVLKKFSTKQLCSAKDRKGNTPLHMACELGLNEAVSILLPLSDSSLTNGEKQTPLHLAVSSNKMQRTTIQSLISHMISQYEWSIIHAEDSQKRTALHMAVLTGSSSLIQDLHHLNVNKLSENGSSPLHIAIKHGELAMLLKLLETFSTLGSDIDLNLCNSSNQSPLHICAEYGRDNMAAILIGAGADLTKLDGAGRTVLHQLTDQMVSSSDVKDTHLQVLRVIIEKAIHWWCRWELKQPVPNKQSKEYNKHNRDALRHLFTEVPDANGYNVLQYAAKRGVPEMISIIMNLPEVFQIKHPNHQNSVIYDVTNLTPDTQLKRDVKSLFKKMVGVHPLDNEAAEKLRRAPDRRHVSLAEIITESDDLVNAAAITDLTPIKDIVKNYWSSYQWLLVLVFIMHIVYMGCLSYFGVEMLKASWSSYTCGSTLPYQIISNVSTSMSYPPLNPQWLILSEPFVISLYHILRISSAIRQMCKTGCGDYFSSFDGVHGTILLQICGFLFTTFTIAWFCLYSFCSMDQDYVLACALIFGWSFSIQFTSGFKQVHHFSIMLQHMIVRDVLKFALIYSFFLLAFGFAFQVAIQAIPSMRSNNPTGADSLFTVFMWLIGSVALSTDRQEFLDHNKSVSFVEVVYSVYTILSAIVLINLLIASMSGSYAEVKQQSEAIWKVGSLRLAIETERIVPFVRKIYHWLKTNENVWFDNKAQRWYMKVSVEELKLVGTQAVAAINNLDLKINDMSESLEKLMINLNQLSERLDSQDKQLKMINLPKK